MKGFILMHLELQSLLTLMVSSNQKLSWKNTLLLILFVIIIVPSISSLNCSSTASDSITLSWTIPEGNLIDNYTLTVTRLCDNVVFTPTTGINGNKTQYTITGLHSGLQYTVSIIPLNILGTEMESNVNATVMEGTGKLLVYI